MTTIRIARLLGLAVAAALFGGCSSDDGGLGQTPRAPTVLTVQLSGSGTVISNVGGINCTQSGGPTCSATFSNDETVVLTATPATNFAFRAWGGDCTSALTNTCTIVMSEDRLAIAIFESTTGGSGGAAFGVTEDRRLFNFNPDTPASATTPTAIAAIPTTETVVGMDFRPQTNVLYAITQVTATPGTGRLYIINETNNTATFIADLSAEPGDPYTGLSGTAFGLDFNPIADTIRFVSDSGQSLTINPANARVTTNAALSTPATAAAYTNAFFFTVNTTLYAYNSADGKLYREGGADGSGTMQEVGSTGLPFTTTENGFDIDGLNGRAVLVVTENSERRVYTLNLTSGAKTLKGALSSVTVDVRGISLKAPRAPEVFGIKEVSATQQDLVRFLPNSPSSVPTTIGTITGLQANESVKAIAFHRDTGVLYALGVVDDGATRTGNVYTLNLGTAAASTTAAAMGIALTDSTNYGAGFNPVFNPVSPLSTLLRIVSSGDAAAPANNDNVRVDLSTGVKTPEADFHREFFDITGAAYTTDADDATLYVIDSTSNRLMTLDDTPGVLASGELSPVGGLGFDVDVPNGFLIVGDANIAYLASKATTTTSKLYTVNLGAGPAAEIGTIGIAELITGIAMPPASAPAVGADIWATTASNRLISFARNNPGTLTSNRAIGNLNGNVVGLEFRPDNSATTVYVLTDTNQICSIVLLTATASCSPILASPGTTYDLQGTQFGFDFDQSQLIWRIVSDDDENLSVNAATLLVTEDPDINDGPPLFIQAAAYTNSYAGATSTSLYVVDSINAGQANARLKLVPTPSDGLVLDVGSLGFTSDNRPLSMDILGGHNGVALVALQARTSPTATNAFSTLYRINLATGAATSLGNIGPAPPPGGAETRIVVSGIAVRFQP